MVEIVESVDENQWRIFVLENPRGNIFQTPEMYKVYDKTKRMKPVKLFAVDRSGNIVASLLANISTEKGGLLAPLATRSIIIGGPIWQDGPTSIEALPLILEEYDKKVNKKALFTEIRNNANTSTARGFFESIGYTYQKHLNILVDINKSPDDLLAGLSKSKRRFIRKAMDNGVVVEELTDPSKIRAFHALLSETYKHAKLPLADISLFESAYYTLAPKSMLKFFMVRHETEYIGGIMALIYNGVITEWYVCGSRAHSKLYPSEMATWYPIKWGAENNLLTFDFGGAGKPEDKYGVRDFKLQFGGRLVEFGRYKKIHSPHKMRVAELGFKIHRRLL